MKRRTLGISTGIAIALVAVTAILSLRRSIPPELATVERPAKSPSGEFVLAVRETDGGRAQSFDIYDASDQARTVALYTNQTDYSSFHTLWFLWDDKDRVWVYSGDVGTYFWERAEDGAWAGRVWAGSGVQAPQYLQKMRPETFGP